MFVGEKIGWAVKLAGWIYPVVCNTNNSTGEVDLDNYGGKWGQQQEPDQFLQAYAGLMKMQLTSLPRSSFCRRLHIYKSTNLQNFTREILCPHLDYGWVGYRHSRRLPSGHF